MTFPDEEYVNKLLASVEARDQLIGSLRNQVAFLEREIARYRKLETAAYEAIHRAGKYIPIDEVQSS